MENNAFFQKTDPSTLDLMGFRIDPSWWSRQYEYPWALQYAEPDDVVADMGCGHWDRPFKHALVSKGCKEVVACDRHKDVVKLKGYGALIHCRTDFVNGSGVMLPARYFDKVFCISVLEDLDNWRDVMRALEEFKRILKNDGMIVITFDVPFITSLPTPKYPGLDLGDFKQAVRQAGLEMIGGYSEDRDRGALNHPEYNLCVFHAVLGKVGT